MVRASTSSFNFRSQVHGERAFDFAKLEVFRERVAALCRRFLAWRAGAQLLARKRSRVEGCKRLLPAPCLRGGGRDFSTRLSHSSGQHFGKWQTCSLLYQAGAGVHRQPSNSALGHDLGTVPQRRACPGARTLGLVRFAAGLLLRRHEHLPKLGEVDGRLCAQSSFRAMLL